MLAYIHTACQRVNISSAVVLGRWYGQECSALLRTSLTFSSLDFVLCPDWDLGRPPRRGAGAEREHFFRYTQRHCMVYPNRSPAEVIDRLKLMFRYNAMKVFLSPDIVYGRTKGQCGSSR